LVVLGTHEIVLSHLQHHEFGITNYMGQSTSWEANSFSANQKFLRILLNPEFFYGVQKILPIFFILILI
jgi:hypothetical protein